MLERVLIDPILVALILRIRTTPDTVIELTFRGKELDELMEMLRDAR